MNEKKLDEMQVQNKNKIGNQSFQLLFYLLLLDVALYGFGVRWVAYPANTMIIATLCCGIYLVRVIRASAMVGPSIPAKRPLVILLVLGGLSAILGVVLTRFMTNDTILVSGDNSALLLMISALVSIVIVSTVLIINHVQNKNDSE